MTEKRELIGAVIAYDIDWSPLGITRIMRAGGTIGLFDGFAEYRITVEEVRNPT